MGTNHYFSVATNLHIFHGIEDGCNQAIIYELESIIEKLTDRENPPTLLSDRITKAAECILEWGEIDGDHHKQWTMDQTLRILLGNEYDSRMKKFNEDQEYAPWDEGIAP